MGAIRGFMWANVLGCPFAAVSLIVTGHQGLGWLFAVDWIAAILALAYMEQAR